MTSWAVLSASSETELGDMNVEVIMCWMLVAGSLDKGTEWLWDAGYKWGLSGTAQRCGLRLSLPHLEEPIDDWWGPWTPVDGLCSFSLKLVGTKDAGMGCA